MVGKGMNSKMMDDFTNTLHSLRPTPNGTAPMGAKRMAAPASMPKKMAGKKRKYRAGLAAS